MNAIDEFEEKIDTIYGVYLDSISGFKKLIDWHKKEQEKTVELFKKTNPKLASIDYLDTTLYMYGKGNPNIPDSLVLHKCTQKEYKIRNREHGLNYKFIGNMSVVAIFSYWEDNYRAKIAKLFEMQKNMVKTKVLGDIRILRRSIIHHNNIALKDVDNCEVLTWFNKGDEIYIDKPKFEQIIGNLKSLIYLMRKSLEEKYKEKEIND
jgi:hypothetical protein